MAHLSTDGTQVYSTVCVCVQRRTHAFQLKERYQSRKSYSPKIIQTFSTYPKALILESQRTGAMVFEFFAPNCP